MKLASTDLNLKYVKIPSYSRDKYPAIVTDQAHISVAALLH